MPVEPGEQYHEPAKELSPQVRTFARLVKGLIEDTKAINLYEQQMAVEQDQKAKAMLQSAQSHAFTGFASNLEFLLREKPKWKAIMEGVLYQSGDIVDLGKKAEQKSQQVKGGLA